VVQTLLGFRGPLSTIHPQIFSIHQLIQLQEQRPLELDATTITVKHLKKILNSRKLSTSGNKKDLIQRLQADINKRGDIT